MRAARCTPSLAQTGRSSSYMHSTYAARCHPRPQLLSSPRHKHASTAQAAVRLTCHRTFARTPQIAKNITLAGVGSVTLLDDAPASSHAGRSFLVTVPAPEGARCARASTALGSVFGRGEAARLPWPACIRYFVPCATVKRLRERQWRSCVQRVLVALSHPACSSLPTRRAAPRRLTPLSAVLRPPQRRCRR
jgi:hypothetical protein